MQHKRILQGFRNIPLSPAETLQEAVYLSANPQKSFHVIDGEYEVVKITSKQDTILLEYVP